MHFLPSSTHLTSRTSPLGMFLTIFLGLSLGSGKVFGVLISSTSVSAMEREILGTGAAVRLTGANAEHAAMATRRRATVKERIVGWWYVMRYGRVVASQSSGHRQQSSSSRKATSTRLQQPFLHSRANRRCVRTFRRRTNLQIRFAFSLSLSRMQSQSDLMKSSNGPWTGIQQLLSRVWPVVALPTDGWDLQFNLPVLIYPIYHERRSLASQT